MAIAAVAGGVALASIGCSSDSDSADSTHGESVTITHALGETTVKGVPERIVVLDGQWLDAALALGVTPVAYSDIVSKMTGTPAPWEPESLKDDKTINSGGDMVEQTVSFDPDLILAPGYGIDKAQYDKLSQVAPTIPALSTSEVSSWTDQVTALGKVLHKESAATKVIDDINGRIDAIAAKNPGIKGKTFLTSYLASPTQLMVLVDAKDGSSELFTRLGMTLPPKLVEGAGGNSRISLSPERLADLNSDLLVATATPEMQTLFKDLPGYPGLPSVSKNSLAFLDVLTGTALNLPTPLNLPYILDKLEPTIVNAGK